MRVAIAFALLVFLSTSAGRAQSPSIGPSPSKGPSQPIPSDSKHWASTSLSVSQKDQAPVVRLLDPSLRNPIDLWRQDPPLRVRSYATLANRLSTILVGELPDEFSTERLVLSGDEAAYREWVDRLLASPQFQRLETALISEVREAKSRRFANSKTVQKKDVLKQAMNSIREAYLKEVVRLRELDIVEDWYSSLQSWPVPEDEPQRLSSDGDFQSIELFDGRPMTLTCMLHSKWDSGKQPRHLTIVFADASLTHQAQTYIDGRKTETAVAGVAWSDDRRVLLGSVSDVQVYEKALTGIEIAGLATDSPWLTWRELSDVDRAMWLDHFAQRVDANGKYQVESFQHYYASLRELETVEAAEQGPWTARLLANRLWERMFSKGLVAAEEDFFGPSVAPERLALLDAMAIELVRSGGSCARLVRQMALSQTFRESKI